MDLAVPIKYNGKAFQQFYANVKMSGNYSIPAFFVITPDGKRELEKLRSANGGGADLVQLAQSAAKELGVGLNQKDYKKLNDSFKKADELLSKEQYKQSLRGFQSISKHKAQKAGVIIDAKAKLDSITEIGKKKLEDAKEKENAKEWVAASDLYNLVIKEFDSLAKEAKDALTNMLKNPEAQEAMKKKQ